MVNIHFCTFFNDAGNIEKKKKKTKEKTIMPEVDATKCLPSITECEEKRMEEDDTIVTSEGVTEDIAEKYTSMPVIEHTQETHFW